MSGSAANGRSSTGGNVAGAIGSAVAGSCRTLARDEALDGAAAECGEGNKSISGRRAASPVVPRATSRGGTGSVCVDSSGIAAFGAPLSTEFTLYLTRTIFAEPIVAQGARVFPFGTGVC